MRSNIAQYSIVASSWMIVPLILPCLIMSRVLESRSRPMMSTFPFSFASSTAVTAPIAPVASVQTKPVSSGTRTRMSFAAWIATIGSVFVFPIATTLMPGYSLNASSKPFWRPSNRFLPGYVRMATLPFPPTLSAYFFPPTYPRSCWFVPTQVSLLLVTTSPENVTTGMPRSTALLMEGASPSSQPRTTIPPGFFAMTDSRLLTIWLVSSLSAPTHDVLTLKSWPAFFHAYLWAFQYSMVLMQLTTTYSLAG